MKLWIRIVALCLAMCMVLPLSACRSGDSGETTTAPSESSGTAGGEENATYQVQLLNEGGAAFEGVGIYVYEDETLAELVWFAKTDAAGIITFTAPVMEGYVAVLSGVPEGYPVEPHYLLTGLETAIVLKTEMAEDVDLANTEFKLGDVMYDLSVTDIYGKTHKLSELLEQKDAVVLNFWYLDCTPCRMEFPYLQAAYEEYSEQIALIALDPLDKDPADLLEYAQELGLTFPVAVGDPLLASAMGINAYPTTIVIDRYGIISLIHQGAITNKEGFLDIFAYFTAEDYEQGVVTNLEDILVTPPAEEEIQNPTEVGGVTQFQLTVRPGETVYCDVYKANDMYLSIASSTCELDYNGKTYTPTNGRVGTTLYNKDTFTPTTIGLRNTGTETTTYTLTLSAKAGSLNNPYPLSMGDFEVNIPAGKDEGIYYLYRAEMDGYVIVECLSATAGLSYDYTLYNLNTYANRNLQSDALRDEDGNVVVQVKVNAGDRIQFSASALPTDSGYYPAIQMSFRAKISETSADPNESDAEKIVYGITVTDADRNPLPNVQVTLEKGEDASEVLTTNEKGVAAAKRLPGTYKATIRLPEGYTGTTTTVTLTEQYPTLSIKLDKKAEVILEEYTVTVKDESGNPMQDVTVSIRETGAVAKTDAEGVAVFSLEQGGSYTAVILAPDGYTANADGYVFGENKQLTVALEPGTGGEDDASKIAYTATVTDYYGNPRSGVEVFFFQNGAPMATAVTDASGAATAKLLPGTYTVTLSGNYYYEEASFSETVTALTVAAVEKRGETFTKLYDEYTAYHLDTGATYIYDMQADAMTFVVLVPTSEGVYKVSASGNAKVGFAGANTMFFNTNPVVGDSYEIEITQEQLENNTFIFAVTGESDCILEFIRTGDIILTPEEQAEWIIYEANEPAEDFTLVLGAGQKLTYVDLTSDAKAVKGSDGYYHLNSADGPILYMNLGSGCRYLSLYGMLGFEQIGGMGLKCVFYDDAGNFIKKEDYTVCMQSFISACTDSKGNGVYPLNDDLIYMVRNAGSYIGWYDPEHPSYLFSDVENMNDEIGWMFGLYYLE